MIACRLAPIDDEDLARERPVEPLDILPTDSERKRIYPHHPITAKVLRKLFYWLPS